MDGPSRSQERVTRHRDELLALHEATLAIAAELDLLVVLRKIVEEARGLLRAEYGALAILGGDGGIETFITSGLSEERRASIGSGPQGKGLLGVVLHQGEHLRLPDLTRDPRSAGFPPNHPSMRSLLAVPILLRGQVAGNLYLAKRLGAPAFTKEDEEVLVRFATIAALGIQNARLHREVQTVAIVEERDRLAREMQDSVAQVLGYVNIKTQAAGELLEQGDTMRAASQVDQLRLAAREAYDDLRELILGLRTSPTGEHRLADALRDFVSAWQEESGVQARLDVDNLDGREVLDGQLAEVQLVRIVQEALANVRKHAHAHAVGISAVEDAGWIEIRIEDDGVGFDPENLQRNQVPHFGLAAMNERAAAVGGSLGIDSAPGRGTCIRVRAPTGLVATGGDAA
ncbi:MAG: sensor signal transduction histidine kinase [Chloroflexi bacterium]|nr:sensor signal transduction histidine kinase [Chloroflexota bacterium]